MTENDLLREMLRLHEAGEGLPNSLATDNFESLNRLWDKGLSSYRVTRMVAGNVRIRRVYPGVLTPVGIERAKAIN